MTVDRPRSLLSAGATVVADSGAGNGRSAALDLAMSGASVSLWEREVEGKGPATNLEVTLLVRVDDHLAMSPYLFEGRLRAKRANPAASSRTSLTPEVRFRRSSKSPQAPLEHGGARSEMSMARLSHI